MRKVILLTSVLALGAGSALAQNFQPSEPDGAPVIHRNVQVNVDRTVVTSSVGAGDVGFSAAQGFGPSDANDSPTPRYQLAR